MLLFLEGTRGKEVSTYVRTIVCDCHFGSFSNPINFHFQTICCVWVREGGREGERWGEREGGRVREGGKEVDSERGREGKR